MHGVTGKERKILRRKTSESIRALLVTLRCRGGSRWAVTEEQKNLAGYSWSDLAVVKQGISFPQPGHDYPLQGLIARQSRRLELTSAFVVKHSDEISVEEFGERCDCTIAAVFEFSLLRDRQSKCPNAVRSKKRVPVVRACARCSSNGCT